MVDAAAKTAPLFDPPQWAQRRQLVSHLLHNTDGVIYLRAPIGGGKTRFAATLLEHLSGEFQVTALDKTAPAEALEAFAEAATAGTSSRVSRAGRPATGHSKPALLMLDHVDGCSNATLRGLKKIADDFGRVVLLGRGGPAALAGSSAIRWIDLPGFTEDQTRAFATSLDAGLASRLGPEGVRALYLETSGLPGKIINRVAVSGAGAYASAAGRFLVWLGAGLLVVLVGWVIWEQDRVNAWFTADSARPIPTPSALQPTPEHATPIASLSNEMPSKVKPPPVAGTSSHLAASADAGLPEVVAEPYRTPLLKSPPTPRRPPKIDLPTVDILREIVREPWLETKSDKDSSARATRDSTPTVRPNRSAKAQAADTSKVPPNGLAVQAEVPRPDKALTKPVNIKPLASRTTESHSISPPASKRPTVGAPATVELADNTWLQEMPPTHYTLQLVGARNPGALDRFIKRYALSGQMAVFERQLDGRPWFALLLGNFPDRRAAMAERAKLPGRLAKEAWPRRLQDIHNLMKINN